MWDFLVSHKDIKIAMNLHSWGNLLITPYNYDDDRRNMHLINDPINVAYQDIWDNSGLPWGNLYGSGIQSIFYTANGDANDYMLHELWIFAITSELGTQNRQSEVFFPSKNIMFDIGMENFGWMNYTFHKLTS